MPRIELNGERESVWLTPHLRDPQPEGEREIHGYKGGVCLNLEGCKGGVAESLVVIHGRRQRDQPIVFRRCSRYAWPHE